MILYWVQTECIQIAADLSGVKTLIHSRDVNSSRLSRGYETLFLYTVLVLVTIYRDLKLLVQLSDVKHLVYIQCAPSLARLPDIKPPSSPVEC